MILVTVWHQTNMNWRRKQWTCLMSGSICVMVVWGQIERVEHVSSVEIIVDEYVSIWWKAAGLPIVCIMCSGEAFIGDRQKWEDRSELVCPTYIKQVKTTHHTYQYSLDSIRQNDRFVDCDMTHLLPNEQRSVNEKCLWKKCDKIFYPHNLSCSILSRTRVLSHCLLHPLNC